MQKQSKYKAKPWITKGLQNACKKKNLLFKHFLEKRTKEAELKYKLYKNKLVNILRKTKKDYYNNLLEQHRSNIKETWKVLNSVIKGKVKKSEYPKYFTNQLKTITNPNDVANEFNNYFVNVGVNLANNIVQPELKVGGDVDIIKSNTSSIFLKAVEKNEIINIINKFKNKKINGF